MTKDKRKASNLRICSDDELIDRIKLLAKEAMNLRFQRASGQLENTARFREIRRETARILTIRRERLLKTQQG